MSDHLEPRWSMGSPDDEPLLITDMSPVELARMLHDFGYPMVRIDGVAGDGALVAKLGSEVAIRGDERFSVWENRYRDYSFCAGLPADGVVPAASIAHWNRTRRFTRLYEAHGILMLEMDISLAGGVTPGFVLNAIERWERAVQDLLDFIVRSARCVSAVPAGAELLH
ncbi:YbjN domain-containing protein [Cupriavidus basilensis]|uniref:YbjN domain-containing protein n=1 Tax=Cupriavidus basilensis TaxID=68895 RepID=A0ABT6ATK3_9BURK|nr:YbjN domain-containing protein [Cupriavidus basilensis]MDF3835951.1 YbjN domain-containing protein [Cupriavidus basilensis]